MSTTISSAGQFANDTRSGRTLVRKSGKAQICISTTAANAIPHRFTSAASPFTTWTDAGAQTAVVGNGFFHGASWQADLNSAGNLTTVGSSGGGDYRSAFAAWTTSWAVDSAGFTVTDSVGAGTYGYVMGPSDHGWAAGLDIAQSTNEYGTPTSAILRLAYLAAYNSTTVTSSTPALPTTSAWTQAIVPQLTYSGTTIYLFINDGKGNLYYGSWASTLTTPPSTVTWTLLLTAGVKDSQFSVVRDQGGNIHLAAANASGIQYWYWPSGGSIGSPITLTSATSDRSPVVTAIRNNAVDYVVVTWMKNMATNTFDVVYAMAAAGSMAASPSVVTAQANGGANFANYPTAERVSDTGTDYLVAWIEGSAAPFTVKSQLVTPTFGSTDPFPAGYGAPQNQLAHTIYYVPTYR